MQSYSKLFKVIQSLSTHSRSGSASFPTVRTDLVPFVVFDAGIVARARRPFQHRSRGATGSKGPTRSMKAAGVLSFEAPGLGRRRRGSRMLGTWAMLGMGLGRSGFVLGGGGFSDVAR